jgi:uncharacterized protein (TIRG00374 family)
MLHYAARIACACPIDVTGTTTPAHPPRSRRLLLLGLKIAVSVVLLYVLLANVDLGRLWTVARTASIPWLVAALALYLLMSLVSAWRWNVLLRAQRVDVTFGALTSSILVAMFFNNFLPSNIGGDVVRIRDTARRAGSKTLATTVVLLDRGLGLLGLVFVAAIGATAAARRDGAVGIVAPGMLWLLFGAGLLVTMPLLLSPHRLGRLLRPLEALHQEWVRERVLRLTSALSRFREAPGALATCFLGGVVVQLSLVAFYVAIARSLGIPIEASHLAVLVPLSFIVQMVPVSVNGFGVREATFTLYFTRLQLPAESALALSFIGAALVMLFSLSGAAAYLLRRRVPAMAT